MKEKLQRLQDQGVWAGGCPAGHGGDERDLFDHVLVVQVVSEVTLPGAGDSATGHLVAVAFLGEVAEGGLDAACR